MVTRISRAFTLVEILIVVVILGILAAIVIPQFTSATQDAQAGNIKAQIGTIQRQIELYRSKNNNSHPFSTADWTTLISGNYIKAAPSNPASTYADKTTLSSGASGTGSAATSWFFNTTDNSIYASFFNESTGVVSTTGTD